ncbi:MBL fold metallo-hydrolase [Amycolatopsis suaedae]|uniref:MBL fold metallo-hydrolase n=1 Tax=Amycolatopsis suaedae TaxID=2510978 RepID=A0A4Q7IXE5_9PSEU|nr:MBL fold metallo-hydrolase [Amycolatopsis suaedae]RZQ59610.1 MBL fold metallo-hydrolase [Amycolatopsis suaedae]
MTGGRWLELAPGVYARRYTELDLTVGLVVGDRECLVIDTRGDHVQGRELAGAVRAVTPLPWQVALTHAHFDHSFGTVAFLPCPVWAHPGCREELSIDGDRARAKWAGTYREQGRQDIADAITATRIALPDRMVTGRASVDLGGRTVTLWHPGAGHTRHDLVVHVPDTGTVFAGDLLERGEDTGDYTEFSFNDTTSLADWPVSLDAVLALGPVTVVPGHGDPAGPELLVRQRDTLARLAALRADVTAGRLTEDEAVAAAPLPAAAARAAFATAR